MGRFGGILTVVNNAGTLDLTNGGGLPDDTLTVNGTLNSLYGRLRLDSVLNGGGALSNQSSDILRVTGDVNGTALIEVTPAAASTGVLSDANQNAAIQPNEGVSLVQVAGNARADSFALQGGYLAAGPWRYDLYSFAPGNSEADQRLVAGSGSQFWDYRLANGLVTSGSSSRAAVVPQVPSYISAPVGLALHRRDPRRFATAPGRAASPAGFACRRWRRHVRALHRLESAL